MRSNGIEGNYRCCMMLYPKLISEESPVYFKRFDWSSLFVKEVLRGWNWMLRWFEVVWKGWWNHWIPFWPLEIWAVAPWDSNTMTTPRCLQGSWKRPDLEVGCFHSCQEELSKFQREKTWKNLQDPKISSVFRFIFFHSERVFTAFNHPSNQPSDPVKFSTSHSCLFPTWSTGMMWRHKMKSFPTICQLRPAFVWGSNMHTILIICIIVYMHDIMN